MFDDDINKAATEIVQRACDLGLWITTAESCTGGLIAGALTSVSGASACVGAGFVTYSNEAKEQTLGVLSLSLITYGAVSEEVVREMVLGALKVSGADLALAVTGIAGPGGGSEEKPVGLVYIAVARRNLGGLADFVKVERYDFGAIGRQKVRRESVLCALKLGLANLSG